MRTDTGYQKVCKEREMVKRGKLLVRQDSRDGILGHQFDKRLESFAPCYSQSLLLADFTENHTLLWF